MLRRWLTLLVMMGAAMNAQAQSSPVFLVSQSGTVAKAQSATVKVQCPAGYLPTGYSMVPRHDEQVIDLGHPYLDNHGNPVDLATLPDPSVLIGGGFSATVFGVGNTAAPEPFTVMASCVSSTLGGAASSVSFVKQTTNVAAGQRAKLTAFCPASNPVPIGSFDNAGDVNFLLYGGAPVFGSAAAPTLVSSMPDGMAGAPTGWEVTVDNLDPRQAYALNQVVACTTLANVMTRITSVSTLEAQRFSIRAPVPDGFDWIGMGFDGAGNAALEFNTFFVDSTGASLQDLYTAASDRLPAKVIDAYMHGSDVRSPRVALAKAATRSAMAVLLLPSAAPIPAPQIVTVVEFYNAALDHYFITANPQEISDLDNGVHKGWARTGQSFKAYAVGSSGHTARSLVCRAYGNPAAGLDSHFYSASPDECYATLSKFDGIWLLESAAVFVIDLPDTTTGACPAGDVPIYRVFNNRADANHRYTTSIALRDQMVARGYVAEGYGPNSVTLCALP